jgi:hypothetical protein
MVPYGAIRKPSDKVPDSVHYLRPADIDLVMALGDSVTAGCVADDSLYEVRGFSFAAGGNKSSTSIANFFKQYNPFLKGDSIGAHIVEPPGLVHWAYLDRLNAAQSKATVQDLRAQVNYLLDQLNSGDYGPAEIVVNRMWKHLNVFIGANNLCDSCAGDFVNTPLSYYVELRKTLDYIYEKIPRTIVSLVSLPKISHLKELEPSGGWCKTLHQFAECRCVFNGTLQEIDIVNHYTDRYNENMETMFNEWNEKLKSGNVSSFAVLYHPFNQFSVIPNEQFVSKLDCFHPSILGHQNFAIAVWNSLFISSKKKTKSWDFQTGPHCPDKLEFIQVF